jgi:lipopolysaccharide exporter
VAAIVVFLAIIELLSDLGMKATVVYEQEEGFSKRVDTAFTLNLGFTLLLTLAGIVTAPLVAAFFHLEEHADLFRLGAASLLFTGLGNIHDSLLLREMEFKRRIVPDLVRSFVRGSVAIVLALAGAEAEALVVGMVAGSAAWMVVQWTLTAYRPRLSFDWHIAKSMAGYGSAAFLLQILVVISSRAVPTVIGRVLGATALGLYTVAYRVPELLIQQVTWNVSTVAFPAFSRKRASDLEGLPRATLTFFRYLTLYTVPLAVGIAVLAAPLIVVLFSSKWQDAAGVMAGVSITAALTAIAFTFGDVLKAVGRQRVLVILNVIQLPVLVATIILVAPAGIVAVAWARAAAMASHATLIVVFGARVLKLGVRDITSAVTPAVAAAAGVAAGAGAVRLLWPALSLPALVAGSLAGAGGGVLCLRIVAPETLDLLRPSKLRSLLMRRATAVS